MKQQLIQRLQTLKSEFESGQKVLAELEAKQTNVRDTLLRISGAIQVLEELLSTADAESVENGKEQPEENTTGVT
jgi:prefoldin subunit 5